MKIYKQYLRNSDNTPYGVVVLVKTDNFNHLGYSLANPRTERFNKKKNSFIAMNRAFCGKDCCPKVLQRKLTVEARWFDLLARAQSQS